MDDRRAHWHVDRTWDDQPIGEDERVLVTLRLGARSLRIEVDAPLHGDPAPPGPPGSLDQLWQYEVVELFLLGEDERYLEIELSPHGHFLVLALHGVRRRAAPPLPARVETTRQGARWRAVAELDAGRLPAGLRAGNAFAIHGVGAERRHLVAHPTGGEAPDFHRIEAFPAIVWHDADRAPA